MLDNIDIDNLIKWRKDFWSFVTECLGHRKNAELGWKDLVQEHKDLCDFLQHDKHKFKLILMPRYSLKSCIANAGCNLWDLVKNENKKILIYSDSAGKAEGFLSDIKNHIEGKAGNSVFRDYYPDWETDSHKGTWNQSQIDVSVRKAHSKEPSIDTGGIESSKVGLHYHKIVFDDIVSDLNVTTKAQMDKVWDCYRKSLSLLEPGGEVVVIGTRWNFGDAYGRILEEARGNDEWGIFVKKAVTEDGRYPFKGIGLDKKFLAAQKVRQGSYFFSCNPAGTPILMGDWTYKDIENINIGDSVVGWKDKEGKYNKPKLTKSKVLFKGCREADVVKVIFKNGNIIRCTADHKWWSNKQFKAKKTATTKKYNYWPAEVGKRIAYLNWMTCSDNSMDLKWLAGIFDGEGSTDGQNIKLYQDSAYNYEVCAEIERILRKYGFDYGKNKDAFWIKGGIRERHRFLLLTNPVRKKKIINTLWKSDFVQRLDEVERIVPDGRELVYSFQTETGNYVAWGYCSKNCLYQNDPVDDSTALFRAKDFAFYKTVDLKNLYITCACDPAGSGEDYTAFTVVGTDKEMRMYVLYARAMQYKPHQIINEIVRLSYAYKFTRFGIEVNTFNGMLETELKQVLAEERKNPKFNSFGIETMRSTVGKGKHARILSLQPIHERGDLLFEGETFERLRGDMATLGDQMVRYTHSHRPLHDDLVDSLSYHVQLARRGEGDEKEGLKENSIAAIIEQERQRMNFDERRLPRKYRKFYEPIFG